MSTVIQHTPLLVDRLKTQTREAIVLRLMTLIFPLCVVLISVRPAKAETVPGARATRPNILLIMVDDLGFADIGCYGSEIETPRLDRLAAEGLRFSQFYSTAKCETARVSLLTGLYHNQAGFRSLNRATTVAHVLRDAGYATSMAGKWHLEGEPTDFGFDRYWGHLSGETDYFVGNDTFRLNGEPWGDFDPEFLRTRVGTLPHRGGSHRAARSVCSVSGSRGRAVRTLASDRPRRGPAAGTQPPSGLRNAGPACAEHLARSGKVPQLGHA